MFQSVDAVLQGVGVLGLKRGHAGLDDDGAAVHFIADEMHGASGQFDAPGAGVGRAVHAGKGGQQGRVDIEHPAGEGGQKIRAEQPHVPGQGHGIRPGFTDGFGQGAVIGGPVGELGVV